LSLPISNINPATASAIIMSTRWIGFDMDDCIGNVMPIARFVRVFDPKIVADTICPYEMCGETWLLRPGMTAVIAAVADATASGAIAGAFIYSNNSSSRTVEFARCLMNAIAAAQKPSQQQPPFKVGFNRGSVSRSSDLDKNFIDICNMLHCVDLPVPSTPNDVLFFDDQIHPLITEIPHYYRVPKYNTWVSVSRIVSALQSLKTIDSEMFTRATVISFIDQDEQTDPVTRTCPPNDIAVINVFLNGIRTFIE
jgi:hypothetical protein